MIYAQVSDAYATSPVSDVYATVPVDLQRLSAHTGEGVPFWPFAVAALAAIVLVAVLYAWHQRRT